jgi:DNA repair protein RecO (recombination protein O)
LRSVPFGEADLVLTFFTETTGVVAAIARAARRPSKRFISLEPIHRLRIEFEERPGSDLATLVDASLDQPRLRISSELERLDAAGRALRWLRRSLPPHTKEPEVWQLVSSLFDALDAKVLEQEPSRLIGAMGLRLLGAVGWGLDFARCVTCARGCGPASPAYVDPTRGGLVCRACGGARMRLSAPVRRRLLAVSTEGAEALDVPSAAVALDLIEQALSAHVGGPT